MYGIITTKLKVGFMLYYLKIAEKYLVHKIILKPQGKLFYLDWFDEKMQNILDKIISVILNKYVL